MTANCVSYNNIALQALHGADIVVATGGGYLTDSDKGVSLPVLSRLKKAKDMGKFTVMVGQGVGIMDDPELRRQVERVLPTLDLILVREENFSVPYLTSLGVPSDRIYMSGDDAIELGYYAKSETLGNCIGVGIRLATYTEVRDQDIELVRPVLHSIAANHKARLVGLPTTCSGPVSDQFKIAELLEGYPDKKNSRLRFDTITELIRKVGRCRLVISGAFHSAVFALSQGIPVICIAKSREYSIKFGGLADQFGNGCQVLGLSDKDFQKKMTQASDWLWESAEMLRPNLIEAARYQIENGMKGYQHIQEAYRYHKI